MAADGWSGSLLVARGDEVLLESSAGRSDAAAGPSCGPGTRFQAGSISKQVVAAAVLLLVEQGRLDLGAPLARWLPGADPAWGAIRVHHLLSHTAGLGHWSDLPELTLEPVPPMDDILELVAAAPLPGRPGGEARYSGPGYLFAARIVELAGGTSYGAFVTANLLGPAGLGASPSGHFPIGEPGVARGHHDGQPVAVDPGFTALPGTGDLWATAAELARWSAALHGGTLLAASSLAAMRTRHAAAPAGPPGPIAATGYGYGLQLGTVLGRPAFLHPGDNPGYRSLLAWLPDPDLTIALLTNDDGVGLGDVLRELVAPVLG